MPTQKPRLQITVPEVVYDTFRRLAAYQGRPMASLITELLEEITPMLQATVAALDQVQKSEGRSATALVSAVTRMKGAVERLAEKATGQLDLLASDGVPGAGARAAGAAPPRKPRRKGVKGRKRRGAG